MLLKHVELKSNQKILDIGSGAGFPLFELAERLGDSCKCYGLDNWKNANARAKKKIKNYAVTNVEVLEGSAEEIPFEDNSLDLIVSNLGINNFDYPEKVFKECFRVLKKNSKLALTTNLNGHWKGFYNIFEVTLRETKRFEEIKKLNEQQEHRGTIATITKLFINSGFRINRIVEEKFEMFFLNGSAFLNHHFVKVGWLSSWLELIPENERKTFFTLLEKNLNLFAEKSGRLTLTVPMLFIEGVS